MRGLVVVGALAAALVVVAAAPARLAATAVRPASCATPTLQLAGFAQPHAPVMLHATRSSVGLRLERPLRPLAATLFDYSGCIDARVCVLGEPCPEPVQPAPKMTTVRVARLAGVRPRIAVADLGKPNGVYVGRVGIDCLRKGRGAAFARCLRAASR